MVNCDADRLIFGRVFQWRKTRPEWLTQIFVASRFLILAGRQSPVSGRLRRTLFFEDAYHAVSPEFPGRVRAFLKQRFGPDFVSIFMPGLAGSAIPEVQPSHSVK